MMSYLFSQKDYATLKIDIFGNMGVVVDNFKLYDILVGKPMEKRGNATKSDLLKHYIICRMKIPKISKRVVNERIRIGHVAQRERENGWLSFYLTARQMR